MQKPTPLRLSLLAIATSSLVGAFALAQTPAPDVPPGPAAPESPGGAAGAPPSPAPSASPAPPAGAGGARGQGVAFPAPSPSGSAAAAPADSAAALQPDGGAPAPSASASAAPSARAGVEFDPSWYDSKPAPSAAPDAVRPARVETRQPLVDRVEVGGSVASGLDATDASSRAGGFYGRGAYLVTPEIALSGRYAFASGHVVERLRGNKLGQFGVPNDTDVLESRHAFEAGASYVAKLNEGETRFFAMPYLGPRLSFLVNDVAPRWAFEADLGLRVGAWSRDRFEASAFLYYDPAIAKATGVKDAYGTVLAELRFGATTAYRLSGKLGASVGYEGNTVILEHGKLSAHALVLGVNYWFR